MWWLRVLAAACFAFVLTPAHAAAVGERVTLPDVKTLDGNVVTAQSLAGKPVLVVFWASWCPYCAKHNPGVQKLIDQSRNTDLQVLTVTIDKDLNAARSYLKDKRYTFAATADVQAMEAALGKKRALPKTYLIGRDGKLAFAEFGEMFEEDLFALQRFAKPI